MRKSIEEALNLYGEREVNSFRQSPIFFKLNDLANQLGFLVEYSFEYGKNDSKRIYLWFDIVDQDGNFVTSDEYDEYSNLGFSTLIIEIDKKGRVKFYSWEDDEDFIDVVNWAIVELKKKG